MDKDNKAGNIELEIEENEKVFKEQNLEGNFTYGQGGIYTILCCG